MKSRIAVSLLVFFSLGLFSGEFSVEKAKKVDDFLRRVREKDRRTVFLKKVTFTQHELNSYINIFYLKRYAPEVKYLMLNLRKNNYVNGTMRVKLTGDKYESVPGFLKDIEIEFSGKLECKNYRVRYDFDRMEINGTLFSKTRTLSGTGARLPNSQPKSARIGTPISFEDTGRAGAE